MKSSFKDRITTIQTAVIISNFMLGSGILTLPRAAAEKVETPDIWLSVIIGGLVAIAAGIIMAVLSRSHAGKTVFQYNQVLLGKWIGGFLGLCFVVYFFTTSAYQLRAMAEVTGLFLLEGTPSWAIMMVFMWVSLYLMIGGINPIARLFEIILPLTIVIYLLVMFMSLRIFEWDNLRPFLGQGLMPVLAGVKSTSLSFLGVEVILVLTAFMNTPDKSIKAVVYGTAIPLLLYLLTVIVVIGGLSLEGVLTRAWPTLDLIRSYEFPGLIFERFESLLLVIWIMQIYSTFTITYFVAALGISQIFKVSIRKCLYILLPIVFIISTLPQNINVLFKLGDLLGQTALYLFLPIPILLLLLTKWRKRSNG
ncbi:spore gernimation protein [Paenibacillus sp. FSL H8-0548]|uniref:spore germination protein n=1 Tax=Paenibacillus sp. FSL H8-0548 TaxID=1920422 RepID=UPI00096E1BB0|nr:spore germination protein [Paenibacillus sp. FSL H8-0548]OMF38340.1 spore gernimation protein [Paenibacillus sp. FSL H8-0548]